MPVGLAGLATCWREQKTQMPTPQEIELRSQLARRDERILELEKLLTERDADGLRLEWLASNQMVAQDIFGRMHPGQEELKVMMEQAGLARVDYFNLSAGVVALHRGYKI